VHYANYVVKRRNTFCNNHAIPLSAEYHNRRINAKTDVATQSR